MTWENRLRLLGGILGVVVLVAVLTVVFNQRQNQATSFTGEVTADVYTVGADHAGTVVAQEVQLGQEVSRGQVLFTVQSLQLKEDLANGLVVGDTDAYRVDPDRGTITYLAVVDGVITALRANLGNSVPTGGALATLTASGDRAIEASFRLVPRDYARVVVGAPARVRLSSDQVVSGTVTSITAATSENGTVATMRIAAPDLTIVTPSLASPGAPVTVTVELLDSGPLAGVNDLATDFLTKIGLR